jgi:hypothetical protein
MTGQPLISVVATSRNDNHGKNLLYRMQMFVDGFIAQCKKHDLHAELILVEWNPPDDTLPLAKALSFPLDKGPCSIRIIRVPQEIHHKLKHADQLPLFQMIGKNVGIRRALGKFVLATNIDILFSDDLIAYMKHYLTPNALYRVDRLDVPEILPQTESFDEIMQFCFKNYFRINGRLGTQVIGKIVLKELIFKYIKKLREEVAQGLKKLKTKKAPYKLIRRLYFCHRTIASFWQAAIFLLKKLLCVVYPNNSLVLHTNACGDFTLLSRDNWEKLKGYPEWNMYSWHLDSILLYQARHHGIKARPLPTHMPIFHIEHDLGSGYSPEGAHLLFDRLESKGISFLSNTDLSKLGAQLKKSKAKVTYNDDNWGMADYIFEEVYV